MSDDLVTIKLNGKDVQGRKGAMLIEVADEAGVNIPRFCYHKKLSVAANCRMCLVEVEKAAKPLPACATPVMDGMVVYTRSKKALAAQKGTMEFLLINHPLDCPICDQGGECELQDVAMGYGESVSSYSESKRVVKDKDIGPLIATDMTRCIHCTRCVRFGEEVAGMRELGATGRGEFMEIGTYIEKSVDHELSGNVIDLCPVGALTSKPSRYVARPWELLQHASVARHDSIGSNIYVHTRDNEAVRVVPRDNEAINECWISDRDRFSYSAVNVEDRLTTPMIKKNGQWQEVDWEEAMQAVAEAITDATARQGAKDGLQAWVSPSATLEEHYLLQKLLRALGSGNIDMRLRQQDFSDDSIAPVMPWLGMDLHAVDHLDSVLLVGSNTRKDQPMLAHRLRKAAMNGARISQINLQDYEFMFAMSQSVVTTVSGMVDELAVVLVAVAEKTGSSLTGKLADLAAKAIVTDSAKAIAADLIIADKGAVFIGNAAMAHPQAATLRALASKISELAKVSFGYLPEAANSAGAALAGATPLRGAGGLPAGIQGKNFAQMLEAPAALTLLWNIDPEFDVINPSAALQALGNSKVVAFTPFASETMRHVADILLPIATAYETSGTYVNAEGQWQVTRGVLSAKGDARPGWKVLRVLGNTLDLDGFDYLDSVSIAREVQQQCAEVKLDNRVSSDEFVQPGQAAAYQRVGTVPMFALDNLTRRATDLQKTKEAAAANQAALNQAEANRLGLQAGDQVQLSQNGHSALMTLRIDNSLPDGAVYVAAAVAASVSLGAMFGAIDISKA